ncbi:MAG: hypothetical protein C0506_12450 [Anaerolinea sp.]|nr:hypothetical protein [Anaerolinea sp.]
MNTTAIRRSDFRRAAFLALASVCFGLLALLANGGAARGQGGLAFGISPADEGFGAYFSYTLEPGTTKTAVARVSNNGSAVISLRAYAADGISASGGGTAFGAFGEKRTGVGAWLSLAQTQLNIDAGAAVAVPVTIAVPAGAAPGDYVAGIVVEAPPKAGAAGGNVNTSITERAGMAIVVRVPGAAAEKLALGNLCFNQETGSRYFEIPVQNQGAVISTATGTFKLETASGTHVFERPVEMGSLIPTLQTVVQVHAPQDPPPGKYTARVVMTQKDGQELQRESSITIPEKKVNGCKTEVIDKITGQSLGAADNFAVDAVQAGEPGSGSNTVMILGSLIAAGLIVWGLGIFIWRNRPRRA